MFTGIVEEQGTVLKLTNNKIAINTNTITDGAKLGDSIAVDGVCLTVTSIYASGFEADMSEETLKVTTLSKLKAGSRVNLERAIAINGRFGGHIVLGHVDGLGKVINIKKDSNFYNFYIELTEDCKKYTAPKGSIAINGISLTIANIKDNNIELAVIPHTYENTNLKNLQNGDIVNIETDILAKYVEKFLSTSDNKTGIDMEFLIKNGFC